MSASACTMNRPTSNARTISEEGPLPAEVTALSLSSIVLELARKIYLTPGWLRAFEKAVETAVKTHVDMKGVNSIPTYLAFLQRFILWVPSENVDGTAIYDAFCLFYFILDQPSVKGFQNPIEPSQYGEPKTFLTDWLVRYSRQVGAWLNTPESLTPETLETFRKAKKYRLDDYIEPEKGWQSFNDFFARRYRPGKRPLAPGPQTIIQPTDATYGGQWDIDDEEAIVTIKSVPWPIRELLAGSKYSNAFKGGKFTHSFLNTFDYHRQHAPVSGKVVEARNIDGYAYLQVEVEDVKGPSPTNLRLRRMLVAPDSASYQFLQLRGLVVIDSPEAGGLVAILPVGMAQVSSVVLNVKAGDELKKGDEISHFLFGGSDIVVCYQKQCNVTLTAELGRHYLMGEKVGTASPTRN